MDKSSILLLLMTFSTQIFHEINGNPLLEDGTAIEDAIPEIETTRTIATEIPTHSVKEGPLFGIPDEISSKKKNQNSGELQVKDQLEGKQVQKPKFDNQLSDGSEVVNGNDTDPAENQTLPCTRRYSCSNMTTVRICKQTLSGGFEEVYTFSCRKKSPYCNPETGTCQGEAPPFLSYSVVDESFSCPQKEGRFPHPTSSEKYYVCHEGVAHLRLCSFDFCYDSITETCKKTSIYYLKCNGFDCVRRNNSKTSYGSDKRHFAYCVDEKVLLTDRCPGNYSLNETSQVCVPNCQKAGEYISDEEDSTKYYICEERYIFYRQYLFPVQYSCPYKHVYDPVNFICSPLKDLFFIRSSWLN